MGEVKCKDCGYLVYRNRGYGNIVEASRAERERGDAPHNCANMPECGRGVNLQGEYSAGRFNAVRELLHKPRTCALFMKHVPGLLPKEHLDMDLLQQQNEFHRSQMDLANKRHRQNLWIAGAAVAVATISAVIALFK